jgi:hypothetical protein
MATRENGEHRSVLIIGVCAHHQDPLDAFHLAQQQACGHETRSIHGLSHDM